MSEKVCRTCRQESWNLRSLDEYCEGLQLSVLVMVICPIKIEISDNLPKFICNECVEVIIGAFKLREESIDSDRYFRERVEIEADPQSYWETDDEPEIKIKSEQEDIEYFADPLPLYSHKSSSQPDKKPRKKGRKSGCAPSVRDEDFEFSVELYRQGKMKSTAWDFFGRLVDKHGVAVDSEFGFLYCKICVEQKKSAANRYKCENISTGMIFTHLKNAHKIGKGNEPIMPDFEPPPMKHKIPSPAIQGLTFSCMDCSKTFKMKMCLEIHQQLEHTGIADQEPINKEYIVDLSQKRGTTSMAWNYFGFLLGSNFELIDDQYFYCRLCVGVGNLNGKYLKSCSTTTLLHHIRDIHLEKKKRKRFSGEFGESSMTPEKITKQEII
jgi:Zinc-finger associated domain (zf-AD)